ncbi:N-acetylmuramoyl-L-alanine amidase [Aestuariicoccus sp. MJ-SS9]|uniref:N-acetylmuramoyl-L-alanine amidase n=1 Tax=Aestuariicoccus sp. MJ-SS9 TaxID=3079855 RepID=UPI0029089EC6|nr:N-acetylmuramoyl-L-alanine amidase [Aestuariicoccus sp. MJ-SS9]MDU8911291.1 N-acetylmuramoyl-L-alanine amidase [Aestuariicoccus sp. MJ-SS9]
MIRLLTLCLGLLAGAAQAQDLGAVARFESGAISDRTFGGTDVTLTLSQGVPWRIFTLTDPLRLVLDFKEVDWSAARPEALDRSDRITALRMGPFRPGWSRLVAALDRPMRIDSAGLRIDEESGRATLDVALSKTDAESFAATAGLPRTPGWDAPTDQVVLRAPPPRDGPRDLVVMLDPGHGGIDPGAETESINEAQLMLTFARELQEVLRRAGGFDVRLTREADVFVSLEGRVALAHAAGADLFISLHADALDEGVARGATVYTLSEEASDAASAALAERHDRDALLSGLDLSGSDDRVAGVLLDLARLDNSPRSQALAGHLVAGIRNAVGQVHKRPRRQAGFSVLKAADIPSVLIELGFLSTRGDLEKLSDPIWRAGMAAGIRDGIQSWALEDAALARLRRQ